MILPTVRGDGHKIDWTNIRTRIQTSTGRVQVRFPSMFRDGNLLRFLIPDIVSNPRIDCVAVGLNTNIEQGLACLSDVLTLPHLTSFDLRITQFPKPLPQQFLQDIEHSHIEHLIIRVDSISRDDLERISHAIIRSKSVSEFTFKSISAVSAEALSALGDLLMFKNKNGIFKIRSLHMSIESMCDTGTVILAQSLHNSGIESLELCECKSIGIRDMSILLEELPHTITKLMIGKNGPGCHTALFDGVGRLKNLRELQCSDTSFNPDGVAIGKIGEAVSKLESLDSLALPLFVFDWTSPEDMETFCVEVSRSRVSSLQLVPLFEDIDNPRSRVPLLLTSLFDHLGDSKTIRRLYVETVGGERCLFSENVGQTFLKFIRQTSTLLELQIGYYSLIGYESDCLLALEQCETLIGLTDDSLFCVRDKKKRAEAMAFGKKIHSKILSRLVTTIKPFVCDVVDVARVIVSFCGIDANPEEW